MEEGVTLSQLSTALLSTLMMKRPSPKLKLKATATANITIKFKLKATTTANMTIKTKKLPEPEEVAEAEVVVGETTMTKMEEEAGEAAEAVAGGMTKRTMMNPLFPPNSHPSNLRTQPLPSPHPSTPSPKPPGPWATLGLDDSDVIALERRLLDFSTSRKLSSSQRAMLDHCTTITAEATSAAPSRVAARYSAAQL